MKKSPDAFRTISEVAEWLETPAHVLRFWESKFSQVKPVKRAGGRRYYRPNDMLLLGGLKKLLHQEGMTIRGAQKIMREQGVKYVCTLSDPLDEADAALLEDTLEGAGAIEGSTDTGAEAPSTEDAAPETAEPPLSASDAPPAQDNVVTLSAQPDTAEPPRTTPSPLPSDQHNVTATPEASESAPDTPPAAAPGHSPEATPGPAPAIDAPISAPPALDTAEPAGDETTVSAPPPEAEPVLSFSARHRTPPPAPAETEVALSHQPSLFAEESPPTNEMAGEATESREEDLPPPGHAGEAQDQVPAPTDISSVPAAASTTAPEQVTLNSQNAVTPPAEPPAPDITPPEPAPPRPLGQDLPQEDPADDSLPVKPVTSVFSTLHGPALNNREYRTVLLAAHGPALRDATTRLKALRARQDKSEQS